MSSSPSKPDNSKFLTGVVMGFLAGSTSYFLLSTDQGRELTANLKQKIEDLREQGFELDKFKIGDLELSQLVSFLIEGEASRLDQPKKKIIRKVKKKSAPKKSEPDKFKGV
ncbi:MAG: hypothetical protein GF381_00055 [Candidatus Pacebacteria bacterium]|nr:hypothetical protein [Candidatus Paceibacterota bacterium]